MVGHKKKKACLTKKKKKKGKVVGSLPHRSHRRVVEDFPRMSNTRVKNGTNRR